MTVQTEQISRERLDEWRRDLDRDHATPAVMVGVGHDEHAGEMHVYVPEGTPNEWLVGWLVVALETLTGRRVVLR